MNTSYAGVGDYNMTVTPNIVKESINTILDTLISLSEISDTKETINGEDINKKLKEVKRVFNDGWWVPSEGKCECITKGRKNAQE